MDIERTIIFIVIYLTVGLFMWLDVKTKNDVSLKIKGHKEWKQPRFFKIVPLWLPFIFISLIMNKSKVYMWLYK